MAQAMLANPTYSIIPSGLFLCVNCGEMPETNVYQCDSGHVSCAGCIGKVKICASPVCKVKIRSTPIRSLIGEAVLDSFSHPCPFEKLGCGAQKMKRGQLAAHRENCVFRPSLKVKLCATFLGFNECQFEVSTGKDLQMHLQDEHFGIKLSDLCSTEHRIIYNVFGEAFLKTVRLSSTHYWNPQDTIINDVFLLNRQLRKDRNGNVESICYAAFYLGDKPQKANDYWMNITAILRKRSSDNAAYKQYRVCDWSVRPVYFKDLQASVKWCDVSIQYLIQMKERLYPKAEIDAIFDLSFKFSVTMDSEAIDVPDLPLKRKVDQL